jgi:hypothetical protein
LVNLGYRQVEAEKVVRGAVQRGATTIAEVIRESLRGLRA